MDSNKLDQEIVDLLDSFSADPLTTDTDMELLRLKLKSLNDKFLFREEQRRTEITNV